MRFLRVLGDVRQSLAHDEVGGRLDLGRQPLWSRFFETLGEDPVLAARMGAAAVEGLQGGKTIDGEPYTTAPNERFDWYRARMLGGRTNH